jgi:hypothetical protein
MRVKDLLSAILIARICGRMIISMTLSKIPEKDFRMDLQDRDK